MWALVWIMVWCYHATSHNPRECWSRCMLPYCVTMTQWAETKNVYRCLFYLLSWWIYLSNHVFLSFHGTAAWQVFFINSQGRYHIPMLFPKSIAGMLMTRRQKEWSIGSTVVQEMHFHLISTKPYSKINNYYDFVVFKTIRNMFKSRHKENLWGIASPNDQLSKVIISPMDIL